MPAEPIPQGFAEGAHERLPMPAQDAMNDAQRAAAQALIDGPRKGVYGPFLPLLRSPDLLDRVAKVGEYLRFGSTLDARVRELATCIAARHVHNQFEWVMHAPLARKAGVSEAAIEALRSGARPKQLAKDEECAYDFATELLATNGVSDATYADALAQFGEQGVVELTTLVGYFVMVNWVMNVARTPSLASDEKRLGALPA
ncbi:carboxymuconolactone decarboxylase family protein [Ramlibacter albus]|uniref:Carboxymuconolactone decarboxylase family protein n=1 Tax=Ramlibacter albus TaxID=2079448 RepID=A0A923M6T6_9BURK|nr:carboxymuconolactone decarboxylase family protein [Ramlibacter albus]MBC5763963.1 carboxymuconolactone decarboxylase family protein [Ramlibacter albus]